MSGITCENTYLCLIIFANNYVCKLLGPYYLTTLFFLKIYKCHVLAIKFDIFNDYHVKLK